MFSEWNCPIHYVTRYWGSYTRGHAESDEVVFSILKSLLALSTKCESLVQLMHIHDRNVSISYFRIGMLEGVQGQINFDWEWNALSLVAYEGLSIVYDSIRSQSAKTLSDLILQQQFDCVNVRLSDLTNESEFSTPLVMASQRNMQR